MGVAVAMAAVIALVVVAGVHNLRARRAKMQAYQQAQITVVKDSGLGSDLPPDLAGATLRGKAAPGFALVDLTGKKVSLAGLKGHAVVVNFWATWCGPCRLEMPWFEEFQKKYKDQGLVVLGLSQDEGMSKEDIGAAAKKIGVSYTILMPDENTAKAYGGIDVMPQTFYVNRDGVIVEDNVGPPSKDEMEAHIRAAMGMGAQ